MSARREPQTSKTIARRRAPTRARLASLAYVGWPIFAKLVDEFGFAFGAAPSRRGRFVCFDLRRRSDYVTNVADQFFFRSNKDAEKYCVLATPVAAGAGAQWRVVVGESAFVIEDVVAVGAAPHTTLVVHRLVNVASQLSVFDLHGALLREMPLPGRRV